MKIGSKLAKLREDAGFKRDEVAEKLEIAKSTLGSWEIDTREPSFEMLDKLAALYGTTVSEIFAVGDVKDNSSIESEAKLDFLDKIILDLHDEGFLGNGRDFSSLDDASKQILLGALGKHIQKVINPTD